MRVGVFQITQFSAALQGTVHVLSHATWSSETPASAHPQGAPERLDPSTFNPEPYTLGHVVDKCDYRGNSRIKNRTPS